MPMLIPLAAAAGSIAAGVAAGATTLIGGAMIAGGALTAVGAITKNSKLTKIGGLVSLAGGVAGLATGAWTSAASSLAEQSPMSFDALRASELGSTGAVNAAMTSPASSLAFTPGTTGTGVDPLAATPQPNAPQVIGAPPDIPFVDRQALQPGIIGSRPVPPAGTVDVGAATRTTIPQDEPSAFSRSMSNVNKWIGDNKELVKTGAGILEGSMGQASQQDLLAERMRQQEEYLRRRRAEMSQSIIGLRMPTYQAPRG